VLNTALGLTALGLVVLCTAPNRVVALIGFAVWGLGASVMFPQLYEMAATLPGTSQGAGLGAMAIGQRSGFLLCPVIVGALADSTTLLTAFFVVGACAVMLVFTGRLALPRRASTTA
jgi:fucose permease